MTTHMSLKQDKQLPSILNQQSTSHRGNMKSEKQTSGTRNITTTQGFLNVAIIVFIVTTFKYVVETIYDCLLKKSSLVIVSNVSTDHSTRNVTEILHIEEEEEEEKEEKKEHKDDLFPSMNVSNDSESLKEEKAEECLVPTSCSMGLTTRLLPIKNANGELEWVFTEDDSMLNKGTELDVFKIPQPQNHKLKDNSNELSPTMSNSSNETTLSAKLEFNNAQSKEQSVSPNGSSHGSSSPYMEEEEGEEHEHEHEHDYEQDVNGEKLFQCPHCDASFKIRGYLTRHLKKHSTSKAYSCPFHTQSIYKDENNITHKCHPTGGFSRRDTYKTHLKSRHFKYPKGIKTKNRGNSEGHCSMCGEYFNSAEIWCEIHVEGGECKFLPQDYKGKSRIKNRLRKKLQKNEEITDPELLPFASKLLEEVKEQRMQKRLAKKEKKKKSLKRQVQQQHHLRHDVANNLNYHHHLNAPVSTSPPQHIDTPGSITSSSQYETSSIHSPFTPQTSRSPLSLMTNNYVKEDQSQAHASYAHVPINHHQNQYQYQPQYNPAPYQFDQITMAHTAPKQTMKEDYDDDFCLDVDQLSPQSTRQFNEMVQIIKLQQQQEHMQEQAFYQQQQQHHFQAVQGLGSQYMN